MKKQWCIPPEANAEFVCRMEDVLEVYQRPYDAARPMVCLDEASKQLVGETRVPVPPSPGREAREDYEYVRHGTANLFRVFEALAGQRHVIVTDRRTRKDWAWLDMAEIELGILNRQCLDRRIDDVETLRREVAAWEEDRNRRETTVDWQFTTEDARIKLRRLYPSLEK